MPDSEPKPSLKQRLEKLYRDYGAVAIYTYFILSGLTILGFTLAVYFGFTSESATGFFGALGVGWVMAKASIVIRIPIVLAITPFIARVVNRLKAKRQPPPPELPLTEDEEANLKLGE